MIYDMYLMSLFTIALNSEGNHFTLIKQKRASWHAFVICLQHLSVFLIENN